MTPLHDFMKPTADLIFCGLFSLRRLPDPADRKAIRDWGGWYTGARRLMHLPPDEEAEANG
jgi:hypothetical protein